jgi:hypothetical protein
MKDKYVTIWKKVVLVYPKYYSGIYLDGQENHKKGPR